MGPRFYGLAGVVFTVGSLYISYFFWKHLFGGLVSSLWDGGTASRVLLIVLVLFLLGTADPRRVRVGGKLRAAGALR